MRGSALRLAAVVAATGLAAAGLAGASVSADGCDTIADYTPLRRIIDNCDLPDDRYIHPDNKTRFGTDCTAAGGRYIVDFGTGVVSCKGLVGADANQTCSGLAGLEAVLEAWDCQTALAEMVGPANCNAIASAYNLSGICCQGTGFTCATGQPSKAPTTAGPTEGPTTASPTLAPSWSPIPARPTSSPTTSAPTTIVPTRAPRTTSPTPRPTTATPTGAAVLPASASSATEAGSQTMDAAIAIAVVCAVLAVLVGAFKYGEAKHAQRKAERAARGGNNGTETLLARSTSSKSTKSSGSFFSLQSSTKSKKKKKGKTPARDVFGEDLTRLRQHESRRGRIVASVSPRTSFSGFGLVDAFAGAQLPEPVAEALRNPHPMWQPKAKAARPSIDFVVPSGPPPGTAAPTKHRAMRSISGLSVVTKGSTNQVHPMSLTPPTPRTGRSLPPAAPSGDARSLSLFSTAASGSPQGSPKTPKGARGTGGTGGASLAPLDRAPRIDGSTLSNANAETEV